MSLHWRTGQILYPTSIGIRANRDYERSTGHGHKTRSTSRLLLRDMDYSGFPSGTCTWRGCSEACHFFTAHRFQKSLHSSIVFSTYARRSTKLLAQFLQRSEPCVDRASSWLSEKDARYGEGSKRVGPSLDTRWLRLGTPDVTPMPETTTKLRCMKGVRPSRPAPKRRPARGPGTVLEKGFCVSFSHTDLASAIVTSRTPVSWVVGSRWTIQLSS